MITVAKDNSGDFDSIQKAVDSVSDNNKKLYLSKKEYIKNALKSEK
ncbi:MAG: hypothetical protein ACLRMX_10360 [Lachnospira eligens]